MDFSNLPILSVDLAGSIHQFITDAMPSLEDTWYQFSHWLSRPDILAVITAWWITFTVVMMIVMSLGFGPRGIVAGSIAAAFQSFMYGGFTPAGGIFATFTSMAMLGTFIMPLVIFASIQMIPQFLKTSLSGVLPTGAQLKAATIDPQKLLNGWNKIYDVSFERIGSQVTDVKGWMAPVTPNDRIFEIIGSYAYRVGFSMLQGDMNRYKRLILSNQNPKDPGVINKMIDAAMAGNIKGAKETLGVLQKIIGVFNYLNHEHLQGALSTARQDLVAEIGKADKYMPELKGILDIWKEFESDYYARAVDKATEYMLARKGRSSENPLVIKTGKYYIVLFYAEESPSVVHEDNGRDRKRYDCKRWRFDLGTDTATEGDGKVNIAVNFKSLNDSIIRMETANEETSPNECVPLKVVEFNKSDKFEVTVIGKVHLLFAERYLQKFRGNLMYYVDFMDNQ
ncbi:hypothetical protein TCE0_043r15580 [Talaromyces pinophilus]|uniref:Uncharacterized protein n=1 Tax=Talaromyces pinophilus TaxID=128442 RepID=A0A0B8N1F7_TALPI|nr:hypothetical protein TCE0_043r15580 [Talaromyces pinophilus]